MEKELKNLKEKIIKAIDKTKDLDTLEAKRIEYLGRKGKLTSLLRSIKDLPIKRRPLIGRLGNEIKSTVTAAFEAKERDLKSKSWDELISKEKLDVTIPGMRPKIGHLHPLTQMQQRIEKIFTSMGFSVVEGPEVETEYYNFDALNIPFYHPARALMDTFWLTNNLLLRTHTSPVQARTMEKIKPPLRIIAPGKCYRYEATDASHEFTFYQVEGLMIGEKVSLSHLKAILDKVVKEIFGKKTKTRLRPGYFPFVEPGLELDMSCVICRGSGCSVCKHSGWVEIIPCGMVHPNVIKNVGLDSKTWRGFAFGMGLDRIAMMKYSINDIRLFHSGDLRFLQQF